MLIAAILSITLHSDIKSRACLLILLAIATIVHVPEIVIIVSATIATQAITSPTPADQKNCVRDLCDKIREKDVKVTLNSPPLIVHADPLTLPLVSRSSVYRNTHTQTHSTSDETRYRATLQLYNLVSRYRKVIGCAKCE